MVSPAADRVIFATVRKSFFAPKLLRTFSVSLSLAYDNHGRRMGNTVCVTHTVTTDRRATPARIHTVVAFSAGGDGGRRAPKLSTQPAPVVCGCPRLLNRRDL